MEATFDDGLLYFCVTRDVDYGSELLIWYSDQLAQLLGVPQLDNDCRIGNCMHVGLHVFVHPIKIYSNTKKNNNSTVRTRKTLKDRHMYIQRICGPLGDFALYKCT